MATPTRNTIEAYIVPGTRVHLIGIGGVSMRPLGLVLRGMGIKVTGSDMNSSVMTDDLIDQGIPFDPLQKPDPDITLSIEERQVGGLGIFIVKKTMDTVRYAYEDGKNILTMIKKI